MYLTPSTLFERLCNEYKFRKEVIGSSDFAYDERGTLRLALVYDGKTDQDRLYYYNDDDLGEIVVQRFGVFV